MSCSCTGSCPLLLAAVILAALALVLMAVPWTRRFITRRAWCVLSRHRIQRVFYETRMHTRSGRLPLVLRIHPTEVGERALIWCRAGICFEDFEAHTREIAAACYAREARVEKSRRRAQLVVVNIVRRDTLAAHHVVVSGLAITMPKAREQGRPRRRLSAAPPGSGKPPGHHTARGSPRHPSTKEGERSVMDQWACARCGDSFWGNPPDDSAVRRLRAGTRSAEAGP